ncbi:MAG: aspartate-semialdehyde dehydrogenase [Methanobacteriota archaeon]|nr:MAG: aspartate-semialdehyde dehydrogenase [Euryarchaeota archaeon]
MKPVKVAVLGATGMVGQRFISLLEGHPYFRLTDLAASERSAGKRYGDAASWYLSEPMPEGIRESVVKAMDPGGIDADIVFSALPSSVARDVEPLFAREGFVVASNASAYRKEPDVPLLIPEVNPEHLGLIEVQKRNRGWDGCIITNPNCTTIVLALSLKPLYDAFGIKRLHVVSMQALSGAGYSGVPSMAIIDNVIPYIGGEEEKVESEPLKILGKLQEGVVKNADFTVSASCNRVQTSDGHLESVFIDLAEPASPEDVEDLFRRFKGEPQKLGLPTAPDPPIIVRGEPDRPQPRFDRMAGGGMAITVGRIRRDSIFDIKYSVLGHNTIRGAAGASILNAELFVEKGL